MNQTVAQQFPSSSPSVSWPWGLCWTSDKILTKVACPLWFSTSGEQLFQTKSFSAQKHTNIKYVISFILAWPETTNVIFQSDTQWNFQGSENHVHSYLASTFLAAFFCWLVKSAPFSSLWRIQYQPQNHNPPDPVNLLTASLPRPSSPADLLWGRSLCTCTKGEAGRLTFWQETHELARKGWLWLQCTQTYPHFRHQSRRASGIN